MSAETAYDPEHEAYASMPRHYHGDVVRIFFVLIAVLIFLTQYVGTRLHFTTSMIMLMIIVLVVAAGITNPAQRWIHWMNMLISAFGLLTFGGIALSPIVDGGGIFATKGLVAIIAILFLASLYFSTRTVRGMLVGHVEEERPYVIDPE